MILMVGCANTRLQQVKKPQVTKPKIDNSLPQVDVRTIKFIPAINQMALEWAGTDQANTYGYYIYRSELQKDGEKLTRIATLNNRYSSHYVDQKLTPSTEYLYSISVIGKDGTESAPSRFIRVKTLPLFGSVSLISAVSDLPREVKLLWRPHTNLAVSGYIIERKSEKRPKWKKIATVKGRLTPEYIDTGLKDNTTYGYRIKAMTYDHIISYPSKGVKGKTKPLPQQPNMVKATTNLPKKILLTWEAPSQEDIVGYNIYSSGSKNGYFSKTGKARQEDNVFEDSITKDGEKRYYKITSLDKDGLETNPKDVEAVMGQSLIKPASPKIKLALIKDEEVILNWEAGDNRAVSYNIYKTAKEGFFKSTLKVFRDIKELRFVDNDIAKGIQYIYEIEAVDKNGLLSEKIKAASLKMESVSTK